MSESEKHQQDIYESTKAFALRIIKIEGALQKLDETAYWLELLAESGIVKGTRLDPLKSEADELNQN